jgi:signal transduction histidine kinase
MNLFVERALVEVPAAKDQKDLALRNSLPLFVDLLVDALSVGASDRSEARKVADRESKKKAGQLHGSDRAATYNYTLDQVIYEYHIMRQVIVDDLEKETPLTPAEREVIVATIEQAVSDAATEYSDTLKDIQEKFIRTLAHDFRTPLMAARLNMQMILRKPDDMENIFNKASKASVSLDRLDRMIQDLLDASRMKTGSELELTMEPDCDLNWFVREVADEINMIQENRIILNSDGSCTGNWNETGLRRVVENLASNALKYGTHSRRRLRDLKCPQRRRTNSQR